jgi:hypothetical protein
MKSEEIAAIEQTENNATAGADGQYFAHSSHGLLRLDAEGYVIDREICRAGKCDDCIGDIERFDLEEYRRVFGSLDEEFDILNLAGWFTGGERFEADEDYRNEAKSYAN